MSEHIPHIEAAPIIIPPGWGTLAQALELVSSEDTLRSLGLQGLIRARIVHSFRPAQDLPHEYWGGNFDLSERTRILPCEHQDFEGRKTYKGWVTVLIELDSVRKACSREQRSKHAGGRPPKWDWEGFWLELAVIAHEEGLPETDTELAERLATWFVSTSESHDSPDLRDIRERIAKLRWRVRPGEN